MLNGATTIIVPCPLPNQFTSTNGFGCREQMGAAGSKREKALGDQFPEGERYFGLEIFGNTCYAGMAESPARVDLDGNTINPMTICMIGAGGFIGSHLCEKLLSETPHTILAVDVYNDKIKHLLEPDSLPWAGRIQFHRLNIKNDSRLEGLIKCSDLSEEVIQLSCYAVQLLNTPLVTVSKLRLIHFSTCEIYGKTFGSYLPKDSPLRQLLILTSFSFITTIYRIPLTKSLKKIHPLAFSGQLRNRAEGAENGLEFTIVRPFNWIGPRMDFIPGIDGPSEGVPRVQKDVSGNRVFSK
ncbi:hypothetical protein LXL04_013155 [Taraxacum kok-saghyz]